MPFNTYEDKNGLFAFMVMAFKTFGKLVQQMAGYIQLVIMSNE